MNNVLVVCSRDRALKVDISRYDRVFGFSSAFTEAQAKSSHVTIIPEDFVSGREWRSCEHEASLIIKKVLDKKVDFTKIRSLINIGSENYCISQIESRVLLELSQLLRSLFIVNKVRQCYLSEEEKVDFSPEFYFSPWIYNRLKELGIIGSNEKVSSKTLFFYKIRTFLKNLFFTIQLFSIFIFIFIKAKGKTSKTVKEFSFLAHLYKGVEFSSWPNSIDFFVDDKSIKKDDVLFVLDEDLGDEFTQQVKQSNFNVYSFRSDLVYSLAKLEVCKKALKLSFLHFLFLKDVVLNFDIASVLFRSWNSYILWSFFYEKVKIKKAAVRIMIQGDQTASIIHQNNGVKNIFVYTSAGTQQIIAKKKKLNVTDNLDYTRMHFTTFVCDDLAGEWIKNSENNISEFRSFGLLMSDFVHKAKLQNKNKLRDQIGVSRDEKLITFFDHSVGYRGMMSFEAYRLFIKAVFKISELGNYKVAYKSKKDLTIALTPDPESLKIYQKLIKDKKIIYINDFNLGPFETMGISDLVVSYPVSTVIQTALSGLVKTIAYDPTSEYRQEHLFPEIVNNFSAHNEKELVELIEYWIDKVDEDDFMKFYENEVRPLNGNPKNEGRSIQTFREYLVLL